MQLQKRALLLERLQQIGLSLDHSGQALALLGLGSAGIETQRLDDYSDLDFFAIVQPGAKIRFIDNLDWLSNIKAISYCFRNTVDGYKLLFEDGVFCEFAIFEPQELNNIPFSPGRVVWQHPDFNSDCCQPRISGAEATSKDTQWLVGEALTNLHVGMCRYQRGEKLSAMRFVQQFALDKLVDLVNLTELAEPSLVDPFVADRRIEIRYPKFAQRLPDFMQGYNGSPQSALAQLQFLVSHFEVNQAIKQDIERLCYL
ncbi:hypothetical protein [Psychromonas antarctica]|jgi:hypothetical protein|uniref:hypothetical protein n=1 Tax=Psychromonas antarctica TaxID=67573 RepID=UPI001EE81E4B|nr:hypothetical protein [Psychromonas antarctica]MCG6200526.1 hypothetical protein [Psychromonas antarctica]